MARAAILGQRMRRLIWSVIAVSSAHQICVVPIGIRGWMLGRYIRPPKSYVLQQDNIQENYSYLSIQESRTPYS
jgi:hypothetical protein